jgi:putative phosphoesterase
MKKIGLLSDTHSYLNPKIFEFFKDVDEIWHAGDIGNAATLDGLSAFRKVRAVYGNIDGQDVRLACPHEQLFFCEEMKVYMVHIGGYPGRYTPTALVKIKKEKPGLFISGHSHILKVIWDKKYELLHLNPGSAGNSGLHKVVTMMRFVIDGKTIKDLEIFEAPRNNSGSDY